MGPRRKSHKGRAAFSVITNLRMDLFEALLRGGPPARGQQQLLQERASEAPRARDTGPHRLRLGVKPQVTWKPASGYQGAEKICHGCKNIYYV